MTDRAQFEAMLEALINDDQQAAKEIFHNIVVGKSREIYEELLAEDFSQDTGNPYKGSSKEEEEESAKEEEHDGEDDGEEEHDGEDDGEEPDFGGEDDGEDDGEEDPFASADDSEDGESDEDLEDRVMDLEDALEDLKAEFEQLLAGEESEEENEPGIHGDGMPMHDIAADMSGDDEAGDDELADLMEYVDKIGAPYASGNGIAGTQEGHGVGAQAGSVTTAMNTKSIVDNMTNDMGGTSSNIAQNHVEVKGDAGTRAGGTKGGLASPETKDLNSGNINVPGGKAGKTAFKTQVKGGGIDRQAGFNKPGPSVGTGTGSDVHGDQNKNSILKARK